ncbi:PTS mannose/fructose/sorbose/N-acetylgalactosamine transporter subunit IIC [Lacticaseibacillus suibinensis]|uniref:PTS mannose/fructose/sorbose/N-acetylgalactosamine transporter subunit IIC n=1 Tax=Lacticaseibacillus suibinensis TaxID=2486011 RepID=UPI000F76C80F|nr:PTS sugar transporter subunit IIC [Lacticaseibacillus suibinensis]
MLAQAIGIFFIALIANMQDFIGSSFIGRPLVTGPIVGLLFGDLQQGLIIGATLELAFLGLMGIGATVPPDEIIGGILTTALVLKNGYGMGAAMTLVLPIAALGLALKNILYVIIFPAMNHTADSLIDEGKIQQAANMHLIASFTRILMMTIVTTFAFVVGSGTVGAILKMIPVGFTDGMTIATNLLPAVGFAMLINMTFSKKVAPFFFIGFVCAAYLKVDTVGTAIIGGIVAMIMYIIMDEIRKQGKGNGSADGGVEDDF